MVKRRNILGRISKDEKNKLKAILLYGVPAVLLIGTLSGLTSAFISDITQSLNLKIAAPLAVIIFSAIWIIIGFLITKD